MTRKGKPGRGCLKSELHDITYDMLRKFQVTRFDSLRFRRLGLGLPKMVTFEVAKYAKVDV